MDAAILGTNERAIVEEERRALQALHDLLLRLDATRESVDRLASSIRQLDELFLLVVVGEFNSGKSAFINALIGAPVVKEGVTPTTAQVHLLQYGPAAGESERTPHLRVITAPVDWLRDIHIVDTPGTNAVIREHEAITADFVPRSDLVLFVSSADRPFTESERQFLASVREWGKKVVVVLNKVDLFDTPEQLQEVLAFVRGHAQRLLGTAPEVFPVSARLAQRGKRGDTAAWEASGFAALERFVHQRLDERERLRLKLSNPLGVGVALAARYLEVVQGRLELLREDVRLLDDVDRQLGQHRQDLEAQSRLRIAEIEALLLEMEHRGHRYFDEMLRVGRFLDLLNADRVRQGFEREVVGEIPRQVEQRVADLIDWLVDVDLRQWQQVTTALAERRRQYHDRIVGDPEVATYHVERARLIESLGREAQRLVESYDRQREAASLAEGARQAVATAAAVGAGALGLGAVVTLAASTAAADVTGVLLAGVIATVGLFVIPARRRRAKDELHGKVSHLRETLARALNEQFLRERQRSADRLAEATGPYSRFVRAEQQSLGEARDAIEVLQRQMGDLLTRLA